MDWLSIVSSAFIGTTCMTAFSYVYSWLRQKPFKEPALLNDLMAQLGVLKPQPSKNNILGWVIHYGVGVIFLISYHFVWQIVHVIPGAWHYTIAGTVSGIVGIAIWSVVFNHYLILQPEERSEYFFQLEIAHIIFGVTSYLVESNF